MSEETPNPPGPPSAAPPPPPGGGNAPPPTPPAGAAPPPPSGGAGGGPGGAVSENRTLWYVFSYLWLLSLIPFFIEKDDAEVQWHAKHGIVLLVAEILIWIVFNILSWGASMVLGPLACFGCIGFVILALAEVVLHVVCIVKAVNGERFLIPGVSEFADQF